MSDNNKTAETAAAAKAAAEADPKLESSADMAAAELEENPYLITFKKPFTWEDNVYTEIDLSGMEKMTAKDMILSSKVMEKSGSTNMVPEMSLEYACIFASRASGMPVEFFQALPPREAIKVKTMVMGFLYNED